LGQFLCPQQKSEEESHSVKAFFQLELILIRCSMGKKFTYALEQATFALANIIL
jgi:hypothetical protein